jgi:hypothetical protein
LSKIHLENSFGVRYFDKFILPEEFSFVINIRSLITFLLFFLSLMPMGRCLLRPRGQSDSAWLSA